MHNISRSEGALGATSKAQFGSTPCFSSSPHVTQAGYTNCLSFAAEDFLMIQPHLILRPPAKAHEIPDWQCLQPVNADSSCRRRHITGSSFWISETCSSLCLEHLPHHPLPGCLLLVLGCQLMGHFFKGASFDFVPNQIPLPNTPLALSPTLPPHVLVFEQVGIMHLC